MAAKRAAFLALAIITAVISSGCWDALDINKKSLCTLVLTDRAGDNFVFYAEVPNLTLGQQQETSGAAHYDIVVGEGTTYTNARRHQQSAGQAAFPRHRPCADADGQAGQIRR